MINSNVSNSLGPLSGPLNLLLKTASQTGEYFNPQSNNGDNFWKTPVARSLGNIQQLPQQEGQSIQRLTQQPPQKSLQQIADLSNTKAPVVGPIRQFNQQAFGMPGYANSNLSLGQRQQDFMSRMNFMLPMILVPGAGATPNLPTNTNTATSSTGIPKTPLVPFSQPVTTQTSPFTDPLARAEHSIKYNAAAQIAKDPTVPREVANMIYNTDINQAKTPIDMANTILNNLPTNIRSMPSVISALRNWGQSTQIGFDYLNKKLLLDSLKAPLPQ